MVWKNIKEAPIDQGEIERMFEAVTKVPTQGGAQKKVEGPTKKEFFNGKESQTIQLSMPKLPKPEVLLKAIREYDNRALTNS